MNMQQLRGVNLIKQLHRKPFSFASICMALERSDALSTRYVVFVRITQSTGMLATGFQSQV